MRLLLLRHGRTVAPPGTYIGSRVDPPLSDEGQAQARAAASVLQGRPLDTVLCSPLLRARETCALALPGVAPHIDARIAELDWGDLTGLSFAEVEQRFPDTAAAWVRDGWPTPPNGEHPRDLWRRTAAAVLDLCDSGARGDVLLVCHGGVIRSIIGAARGLGLAESWRVRTPHASLRVQRVTPLAMQRWRSVVSVP